MSRAGLTPERLVAAAADLADEVGFDQVTASAVARRFGVQVASLYSHLGGTDDLCRRVSVLALHELADLASAAVAGVSGQEALDALADAYRDFARAHPGRWTATSRLAAPLDDGAVAAGTRHTDLLLAVLRGYPLPARERPHAVRLVGATLRGFVDLEAGGGYGHGRPSAHQSWRRTLDALDRSLRTWPA